MDILLIVLSIMGCVLFIFLLWKLSNKKTISENGRDFLKSHLIPFVATLLATGFGVFLGLDITKYADENKEKNIIESHLIVATAQADSAAVKISKLCNMLNDNNWNPNSFNIIKNTSFDLSAFNKLLHETKISNRAPYSSTAIFKLTDKFNTHLSEMKTARDFDTIQKSCTMCNSTAYNLFEILPFVKKELSGDPVDYKLYLGE